MPWLLRAPNRITAAHYEFSHIYNVTLRATLYALAFSGIIMTGTVPEAHSSRQTVQQTHLALHQHLFGHHQKRVAKSNYNKYYFDFAVHPVRFRRL